MKYGSHFSRTNFRKFTIAYQGQKFWNTLHVELKDVSSRNVFFSLFASLISTIRINF